ncbi:hypothetical protein [Myxococcus landrumensis]|uniref:Tetratricopeptide repeat protein n=1 Tax=Myxococcus landrumensis TaxID=2813577 RepID=A0ABX7NE56_9BACT|nr:hypothetical protein [Myxococcus landrumus]QSQ17099.1 hypothetical protein JY572_14000 [Myxococcus landrumus]
MKTSELTRSIRGGVLCLTLAGGFSPGLVRAQESNAVQPYVLAAKRLYNDLQYEQALEQIARGKRLSHGPVDDALLSLYEGIIQADLGEPSSSDAAFKAALFLQPDAKLPLTVSPKVSERFESLRKQVKRELEASAALRGEDAPPPIIKAPAAPPVPLREEPPPRAPTRAWLPAAIGGGLLVGSGVTWLMARGQHSNLTSASGGVGTVQGMQDAASRGEGLQTVSAVLAGAGVVGLGVAAGMYLWGGSSNSQDVELSLGTDGTSAFVSGRWP